MLYVGIDPGKNGGLSSLKSYRIHDELILEYSSEKMPKTESDIADWFEAISNDGERPFAMIEKVGSMPGNAARAMFTFGTNYGFLRACLTCFNIPFEEVLPLKWQSGLGIPKRKKTESKTDHKNKLKQKAQQLFPTLTVTLANCDAILIAEYNRRKQAGIL